MEQLKRISYFENILDRHTEITERFGAALSEFRKAQSAYGELKEYYGSAEYMNDWESSNSGDFPENMKCGVLSEDAVFDLIGDNHALAIEMIEAALEILKNH